MASPSENRPDAQQAQKLMQALLNTRISELVKNPQTLDYLVNILGGIDIDLSANPFGHSREFPFIEKEQDPQEVTIRQYLSIFAHEKLNDHFSDEANRKEARKKYPQEYQDYIQFTDRTINARVKGIIHPLKKYLDFLDSVTALADQGKRPSAKSMQNGIKLFQWAGILCKELNAKVIDKAASAEELEKRHYEILASEALLKVFSPSFPKPPQCPEALYHQRIEEGKKPDWMPKDLYDRIIKYKYDEYYGPTHPPLFCELASIQERQDELKRSMDTEKPFLDEIAALLLPLHPMRAEDYKKIHGYDQGAGIFAKDESDLLLHIIHEMRAIAKELRIDTRTRSKEN